MPHLVKSARDDLSSGTFYGGRRLQNRKKNCFVYFLFCFGFYFIITIFFFENLFIFIFYFEKIEKKNIIK